MLSQIASANADTYTYDALGRLKSVTYSDGSTITYAYDPAGNRTTLTQTATP
ncbi:MAG: RHS repeat protein [Rhizobiales bacterium]|nr:RHS repeat protein [Hyphomicrobiales bacterium]